MIMALYIFIYFKNFEKVYLHPPMQSLRGALVKKTFQCSFSEFNKSNEQKELRSPNIYFIESSCSDTLTFRQACAIESACFHNPNSTVGLKHLSPSLDESTFLLQTLRKYDNFVTVPINPAHKVKGTPMEKWFQSGKWMPKSQNESYLNILDMGNAMRWLELFKNGGFYLDLDTIVLQKIDHLKNVVGIQDDELINSAVLQFDKPHHFVTLAAIEDYIENWRGNAEAWGMKGPFLVTNIIKSKLNCVTKPLKPGKCNKTELEILPQSAFYPVSYPSWKTLVTPGEYSGALSKIQDSYIVHFWNKLTGNTVVNIGDNSFYDIVANKNCPLLYNVAREKIKTF